MARATEEALGEFGMPVSAHHDDVGVKPLSGVDQALSHGLAETVGILNGNLEAVPDQMCGDVETRGRAMLIRSNLGIDRDDTSLRAGAQHGERIMDSPRRLAARIPSKQYPFS